MRRASLVLVLAALAVVAAGCGGDSSPPGRGGGPAEVTVGQILKDPKSFARTDVKVRGGRVQTLGVAGFVLVDGDERMLVSSREPVTGLKDGEAVTVTAVVVRVKPGGAPKLRAAFPDSPVLGKTPIGAGDPYLRLRALADVDPAS